MHTEMTKSQAMAKLDAKLDDYDLTPKQRAAVKRAAAPMVGKIDWTKLLEFIMKIIALFSK